MRKNKLMRAAAGLLVATLLTTSIISGTLAKYTTSVSSEDSARVATWGFTESSIDLKGLFNTQYTNVNSKNGNVIAPGTEGSKAFNFTYKGQEAAPEVAYNFSVGIDDKGISDAIKSNTNIQWALVDGTDTSNATWGTWDQLVASVKNLSGSESGTQKYDANKLPTAFANKNENTHTIAWKWNFEGTGTDENKKAQDVTDTTLGNKEALDKVTVKITITATQID